MLTLPSYSLRSRLCWPSRSSSTLVVSLIFCFQFCKASARRLLRLLSTPAICSPAAWFAAVLAQSAPYPPARALAVPAAAAAPFWALATLFARYCW